MRPSTTAGVSQEAQEMQANTSCEVELFRSRVSFLLNATGISVVFLIRGDIITSKRKRETGLVWPARLRFDVPPTV